MFALGKLLAMVAVQRSLSDISSIRQFLVGVGMCLVLALIGALLGAALLIGGLYMIHNLLVTNGLTPEAADLAVVAIILLLILIVVLMINVRINRLHSLAHDIIRQHNPVASKINQTAEAFMSGFKRAARPSVKYYKPSR